MGATQELDAKLYAISKVCDVDYLLATKQQAATAAGRYMVDSLPLPLFQINYRAGNPILSSKEQKAKRVLESISFVDSYISKISAKKVLELGAGSNGGSLFLSWKYPAVQFYRVCSFEGKLEHELKKYRGVSNYHSICGSYEDLAVFEKEPFDIVFSVETLSLADDRKAVLASISDICNTRSKIIIVDGYLGKRVEAITREELIARHLVGRGKSLKEFETYESFLEEVASAELSVEYQEDVSLKALPVLERYEKQAEYFFRFPLLAKLIVSATSSAFAFTMISNYLMPTAVKMGIAQYKVTVLKK